MEGYEIYKDIAKRTQGDIYIGVVGPVRTGKSTFIKKFMETLVIPNIENGPIKERAIDELPQSAVGKTIMTTEPKFIPNEAVEISNEDAKFRVRLIDCVGYIVPSALGYIEEDMPRMVNTPWFDKQIPFNMAAEIGTKKVIEEHSTIGLVVTTDGSIGEIDRNDYIESEDRVITELKEINKPFIVLINCVNPNSLSAKKAKEEIELKHNVTALCVNCLSMSKDDISEIIKKILTEFPVKEIDIDVPSWVENLEMDHWLKKSIIDSVFSTMKNIKKVGEIKDCYNKICENKYIKEIGKSETNLGNGICKLTINPMDDLFYKVICELTGLEIKTDGDLVNVLKDFSKIKEKYEKIQDALEQVTNCGYGIVNPTIDELKLEEPEIVKQGGKYGIKLKASAPSIHMIMSNIETEVAPIVGSEKQSQELVEYLLNEFKESPSKIWESNIFGKSLYDLVNEGLYNKLNKMPMDARDKLRETLTRIINEGSGGLICIIL
ncbi:MAG: stage IV sporulation protein A [Clostridia bacterium]|nr:stage IV sporulation protein A [Clostridia bacterium]